MERSDWIALAACIAAFLGLIPQFKQMWTIEKKTTKKTRKQKQNITATSGNLENPPNSEPSNTVRDDKPKPLYNAFIQTIAAVIILLIELIIFGGIAHLFGVSTDLDTMPNIWKIGFYALFVVPGLLLFMALMWITSVMDD